MRNNQSGNHDKSSCPICSGENMIAGEMQRVVLGAAAPIRPGDTVKAQLNRAWEALGRPQFWRVRAAWYGEAGCWSATAVDDMRRRSRARLEREARAREHAKEAAATLRALRETYAQTDPEFYRDQILAIEQALRDAGCEVRPMGDGCRAVGAPPGLTVDASSDGGE